MFETSTQEIIENSGIDGKTWADNDDRGNLLWLTFKLFECRILHGFGSLGWSFFFIPIAMIHFTKWSDVGTIEWLHPFISLCSCASSVFFVICVITEMI